MRAWLPRLLAIALAALGLVWGVQTLPAFWWSRGIENAADLIIQGQGFAPADLQAQIAGVGERGLSSYVLVKRSLGILKLRLAEQALASGDRLALDGRLADLKRSIVDLLEVDPSDSFFWMIYYWCNVQADGFSSSQLKFLEFSYDTGPREGWIAAHRNRLGLAAFPALSPAMSERVLSEFAGLISSGFIVDAAANMLGPGAPIKAKLLARLSDVPIAEREKFAHYLHGNGVDVEVPGVSLPQRHFY